MKDGKNLGKAVAIEALLAVVSGVVSTVAAWGATKVISAGEAKAAKRKALAQPKEIESDPTEYEEVDIS